MSIFRGELLMGTSETTQRTDDLKDDDHESSERPATIGDSIEDELHRGPLPMQFDSEYALRNDPEAAFPDPSATVQPTTSSMELVDAAAEEPLPARVPPELISRVGAPNPADAPVEDDGPVSQYVSIYVKHYYSITIVQLVLALICVIFVIPFLDLSTPDAGLRMRNTALADRADGFLAAVQDLYPDGFSMGIVGLGAPAQSKVRERSVESDALQLIWYTYPEEDVFSQGTLEYILAFEQALVSTETYRTKLCVVGTDGTCMEPRSAAYSLVGPEANLSVPLAKRIESLFKEDPFFFSKDYLARGYNRITRTTVRIGLPLEGFDSPSDRRMEQNDKIVEILNEEIMSKVVSKAFAARSPNPRLTYYNRRAIAKQARQVLARDLTLSGIALSLVFVCLLGHFRSLFLAVGALLQILMSVPISLFVYRVIFGLRLFGGLHVLSIFLILGIGVDDCFVFFDAFDQTTREHPKRSTFFRMNKAYLSARYAMFATSFTTAICFLSLLGSGIPCLVYFGVFTCILVCFNYALVMTVFAGFLLIWDAHLRPKQLFSPTNRPEIRDFVDISSVFNIGQRLHRSSSFSTREHQTKYPPSSTTIERAFIFVAERLVTRNAGKALIIGASCILIGVLASFAAQMQPSHSIDSFWPPGHPFRIFEELWAEGFYGEGGTRAAFRFMNGLKAPFRINYDYTNDADMGQPVYDDEFDLSDPDAQMFLVDQCDRVRSRLGIDPVLSSDNNSSLCPMNEFRDWLEARGREFPVRDPRVFKYNLLEFVYQPYQTAVGGLGFRRSKLPSLAEPRYVVKFIFNQFQTTRSHRADDLLERQAVFRAWSQFTHLENTSIIAPPAIGKDGSTHPVDGFYEVWMATQETLLVSSFQTIAYSLAVAFVVLFLATKGDVYSAFVGVFCLGGSVACTLGSMYLAGWSLGAVEAVSCVILCGLAVDYEIHMSIAHSETYEALSHSRRDRVVEAMRRLGVSVLYGALTTFLASSVMLMCTIGVLVKFGQFMLMVISFALVFAILLQMAWLSLPVPSVPLFKYPQPTWMANVRSSIHFGPCLSDRACFGLYMLSLVSLCIIALGLGFTIEEYAPQENPESFFASVESRPKPYIVGNLSSRSLRDLTVDAWTEIQLPNNEFTGCGAAEENYSFFVYRSSSDLASTNSKLIQIEFEGRAKSLCFSSESCDFGGYGTNVDRDRFRRYNEAGGSGFPFTLSSQTPLLHIVFPYCTADAFLGNTTKVYDGHVMSLRHVGANNVQLGMKWLFSLFEANKALLSPDTSLVFQGCGIGGIGAVATLNWAAKEAKSRFGLTTFGLISDSATKVSTQGSFELMMYQAYGSTYSLSYAAANETTAGLMLVATSAYDWFQTRLGLFANTNATLFKQRLEQDDTIFPYVLRVNGDRHCVALDPVQDRLDTDPRVQKALDHILKDGPRPSPEELYYKCSTETDPPCERDADFRDKDALCHFLSYARWCVK